MSSCREGLATALVAALITGPSGVAAQPAYPGLGRAATPGEVRAWDIDVRPDFKGLPPGLRLGGPGPGGVGSPVRFLPRRFWRKQPGLRATGRRHDAGRREDRSRRTFERRQLSRSHDADEASQAVDAVGLHQPRDALDGPEVPQHRRGLCRHGLHAEPGRRAVRPQHRAGPAAPAQSRWLEHRAQPVAGPGSGEERQGRPA